MLTHVVVHQPEDPIAYFHEELSRIKKEVEENNVSLEICVCVCSVRVVFEHTCTLSMYRSTIISEVLVNRISNHLFKFSPMCVCICVSMLLTNACQHSIYVYGNISFIYCR